ncbi:glycosyl hydrolase 85 family protein [Lysobacter antibioticus]|uniref:endo-beta-N-acetylglucosaminidase n=1 Tax=Lysobacter antibioticus TaxID=84531 RepID=UPI0007221E52|nr:hypothetical protein [Lysobacter antibioticus]ALN65484.1 glycosyl hydrolase 85 family protein [Lysobacter antibioticus]
MRRNASIALSLCFLVSSNSMAAEVNTYTWALDIDSNSEDFDYLLQDNIVITSSSHLAPSTTPLNTSLSSSWMVDGRADAGAEFTALYRLRPAVKTYPEGAPPPVTFENWAFIRKLIYMGGDQRTGAHVIAPDPNWVSAAHDNGVKIYGTVYIDHKYGNSGMVNTLIGSLKNSWNWDATEEADFDIPALYRLEQIAKELNLDGWFLNIEQGFANLNSPDTIQMRRLLNHIFPKFKARGVEFIAYTGSGNKGLGGVITDDNIADFGITNPIFHGLDLALGIDSIDTARKFPSTSQKTYLMYLDEVFTRNTPLGKTWPLRIKSAKATQCQYFNGAGAWPGFKQYAKARYPAGKLPTALCGGVTDLPIPTTVLKINLMSWSPHANWAGVHEEDWQVTAKRSGQHCIGNCYLEFSTGGLQSEVLEFNYPIEYQANAATWLSMRSDLSAWTGWADSDPRVNFLDQLFVQYMPGFKWWEKERNKNGRDGRGNTRSNNAIGGHVWNYWANPVSHPQQGIACNRVTPEQAAQHGVAQDKSCILQVPTYTSTFSVPRYPENYGDHGQFPLLDLVMQVNPEGFSYYQFYDELIAKGEATW